MSHYLSHMAALAVNRAPVVQPRLASRFEGSVDVAPAEDVREFVAEAPVAHANPVAAKPANGSVVQAPDAQNIPAATPATLPVAGLLQPQPAGKSAAREVSIPAAARSERESQVLVQELIRERIHEQPLLVAAPVPKNPVPAIAGQPAIERLTEQSFFTEIRHEQTAAAAPDAVLAREKPGASQVPAMQTPPVIQTRIAAPEPVAQVPYRQQPQPADAAVPAPNIQVSIGRIEIRANVASASQAARPKAGPTTLSLDDYLKQRKGDR